MRYAVVLLLLATLLGSMSCSSAARHREIAELASAGMQADGVDPSTATQAQWDTYIQKAIDSRRLGFVESIIGVSFPQVGQLWGLIAAALGLSTNRGRRNLAAVASGKTGLGDKGKALAALLLGTHTPQAAREAAA